jgi:hypothetical protein
MEAVARQLFFRRTLMKVAFFVLTALALGIVLGHDRPEFSADGISTVTPRAAQEFVQSIGVTTHLTYADYKSNAHFADVFESVVKPKIRELGIYHVRQYPGETDSNFPPLVAKYNALSNPPSGYAPVSFNFETHIDPSVTSNPGNECYLPKMKYIFFGTASTCHNLENYTAASSVAAKSIENPNEPDHCPSWICGQATSGTWFNNSLSQNANWPDDVLLAAQQAHAKLTTDPQTGGLERLAPAFVWLQYHQNETYNGTNLKTYLEPLKNYITHGNAHPYCNLQSVAACFSSQVQPAVTYYAPKPVIVTETGHSTAEFTELQQAKYLLRILFDFFERGIPRTYIYELLDEPSASTTKEQNFGLINEDGREKPAYLWLKNAVTLLKDSSNASLEPLPVTVTGTSIRQTLLRKSDGSYWLALAYDKSSTVDADSSVAATISFASSKNISLYNLESANAYSTLNAQTSINIQIPDRIVLLRISDPVTPSNGSSGTSTNSGGSTSKSGKGTTNNGTVGTETTPPPATENAGPNQAPAEGFTLEAISQRVRENPLLGWAATGIVLALLGLSYAIVRVRRNR